MSFLVDFFIRNFKLTIVLSVFFVILGVQGIRKMNAEAWPQVDFATAIITTQYKGASPEDIEALITKPIEDEIRMVTGLKDVKSTSQTGLSMIMVRIDMDNVDEVAVMDDLQKAVQRVSKLPPDLEQQPQFVEVKSDEFPAIEVAVIASGDNRTRDAIADLMKDDIEDLPATKEVRTTGFREREFTIELNRKKMDELHIGVTEVLGKLQSRNISVPGGDLEKGRHQDLVKLEAKVKDTDDLKKLVVRSNINGEVILLEDIARIYDGAEEPVTLASYNGQEAVLLTVNKKSGADTLELAAEVRKLIKKYQENWKGKAVFKAYYDEGNLVNDKLSTLANNAYSGLFLLLVFLLIFMPGWIGIMAGISLPVGIMFTFGLMPMFGLNLDSMSILAFIIAMGNLVDNSIVITDNFINLRRAGLEIIPAVKKSVMELWAPITATVLTTIASFLPMLVTKGIMGEFIRPIPIVVTLALFVSLIESFFLLPMRLVFVGKKVGEDKNGKVRWFDRWKMKFEVFMRVVVRHRYLTIVGCTLLIFASLLLMVFGNKFILFPAEDTEMYLARIEAPRGTSIEETSRYAALLSQEIMKRTPKWTREVTGRAGTSKLSPDDPKGGDGDSQGLVIVYANDFAKFNVPYTQYLTELRKIDTSRFGKVIFEELINGPPVGSPINATFRSDNPQVLQKILDHMLAKIGKIPGVFDLKIDDVIESDEILVELNYEEADIRGVSVADVGTTIRTALGGIFVSDVILNNKEVNLNVKFQDNFKTSPAELAKIKIMDREGNLIPLGAIAKFSPRTGTPHIKRFDFKRARTIVGNVDDTKTSAFEVNNFIKNEWARVSNKFPEVSLVFGGVEESTQDSMQSLLEALFLAMVGIFGLLVFMFHSFLRPFIIMMTIPLGFIGFSVAFFLHGKPISFLALIGIIGLTGIIVNSGIVLIEFIEIARRDGLPLEEALVKASSQRLLAVVATAFSTMLGLFPTAYGIGGKDQMLIPITLAMAWGLTSGTILTLIFIPPAYAAVEDWVRFITRNKFIGKIYSIPFLEGKRPGEDTISKT